MGITSELGERFITDRFNSGPRSWIRFDLWKRENERGSVFKRAGFIRPRGLTKRSGEAISRTVGNKLGLKYRECLFFWFPLRRETLKLIYKVWFTTRKRSISQLFDFCDSQTQHTLFRRWNSRAGKRNAYPSQIICLPNLRLVRINKCRWNSEKGW